MNTNKLKVIGLRMFLIVSVLLTGECTVAQKLKNFAQRYELGLEATFGIKTFNLSSDFEAINDLKVIAEGGAIGATVGSGALRAKLRQGYYYSASHVSKTVDYVRSAGMISFYPLELIDGVNFSFQPFITGGIERNILKMYGFYGPDFIANPAMNYSISEAPYLGKIVSLQASIGAGLEFSIEKEGHYVSIFSEVKYGTNVSRLNSSRMFENTRSGNQMTFNIGVAFGYHK